jgi:CheY-like chemotaxis protein
VRIPSDLEGTGGGAVLVELEDRRVSVLLVDPSPVVRELVGLHLEARGHRVEAIDTVERARERLRVGTPGYLILAAEEGGLAWLREIAGRPDPRPHVVVTSRRPRLDEETAVSMDGAIAYLPKPIRLGDLDRAVGAWPLVFGVAGSVERAPRRQLARALLCDPNTQAAMLDCELHDLSRSGAFLLSRVPIPPGTRLRLMLCLAGGWQSAEARVVRIQEPSWDHPGGVGIRFEAPSPSAIRAIAGFLAGLTPPGPRR